MSTPFRERNPVTIGAISLAVIAALMVVAFKAGDLPIIGGGDSAAAGSGGSRGKSGPARRLLLGFPYPVSAPSFPLLRSRRERTTVRWSNLFAAFLSSVDEIQ